MLYPHEIDDEIYEIVKALSEQYIEEANLITEPVYAASLLMGWGRLQYYNENYIHKVCECMKRPRFFFDCPIQDLCNCVVSLTDLHHKDDKLMQILHSQIVERLEEIHPYNLCLIVQSYARVVPGDRHYYTDLVPKLIEMLEKKPNTIESILYSNQWLSLA